MVMFAFIGFLVVVYSITAGAILLDSYFSGIADEEKEARSSWTAHAGGRKGINARAYWAGYGARTRRADKLVAKSYGV